MIEKPRDKDKTKQAFINAAIEIIKTEGFEHLGINLIAEKAGASKVLIYRYFGGLDGLVKTVAENLDPIHTKGAMDIILEHGDEMTPSMLIKEAILSGYKELKNDEIAKKLMIWELSHQNIITKNFSEARETAGKELTQKSWEAINGKDKLPGVDINALLAVVIAGVYYLTLRSDSVQDFNEVNIQDESGWQRIADSFKNLVELAEKNLEKE
ncbi:MAG: TetR/AcrR family transcriptional regulator [Spirochaetales bacterium]|nr:TetR/AcrR family transcriptional regulator [Spirochaetales bacterium]